MTSELSDKEDPNRQQEQSQESPQEIIPKEENCQILIKNIPETMTEDLLQQNFEKYGKILKINIEQDTDGKPTGNAIIEFETKQQKESVLNSNEEFILEGKRVEIKDPVNEGRTLFVGNIPYSSTEEEIINFFSDCGKVDVKLFYINGKSKGFAYVTFQDDNAVQNAFKKNGEKMGEREIKIDRLKSRSNLPIQRGGRRGSYRGRGRGGGPSYGHFDRERKEEYFREKRYREKEWERGRPSYNRIRDRDRDREWNRDRRERSRDRSRDYNNRIRDRGERERGERGERERGERGERGERDRHREFERDRERGGERDRERERNERGDRDRIKERERENERHREYERGERERERRHSNYERDNGYRERERD